jgi:hypothetical protein
MHKVAFLLLFGVAASAHGSPSGVAAATDEQADRVVKALADAQTRVLGKAVAFCSASHSPEGRPLDDSFRSYLQAFSAGTKAGMIEIAKTENQPLPSASPYDSRDLEQMDRQGQQLLRNVQASPADECRKLSAFLGSGTSESFKEEALRGHREYKARREAYCAQVPKPKSCN